ncbi:MAG: hypothetical protein ACK55I_43290, partial [bacterium]
INYHNLRITQKPEKEDILGYYRCLLEINIHNTYSQSLKTVWIFSFCNRTYASVTLQNLDRGNKIPDF